MPTPILILTLTRCGQFKVETNGTCWFALQCSTGFDGPLADGGDVEAALRPVMPWALLGAHKGSVGQPQVQVALSGYFRYADGTNSALNVSPAELPFSVPGSFAESMRQDAERHLVDLARQNPRSIVWKLGAGDGPDEEEGGSLGKFLQYLGTLPGEVARQAGTVLYFPIPAADLFTFDAAGRATPKAVNLWVAPASVELNGALALRGAPTQPVEAYLEGSYSDGVNAGMLVRGPGIEVGTLLTPIDHPVFSLDSYGVGVREASTDLLRLESMVLDAVDPFSRARALSDDLVRDVFRLTSPAGGVQLPEAARTAIRVADQVLGFIARCGSVTFSQACGAIGECLALQLVNDSEAAAFGRAIAVAARSPAIDSSSATAQVQTLAVVLGVKGAYTRDLLIALGAECSELALCRLLAAEIGRLLKDGSGLPVPLAERAAAAWRTMGEDGATRQLALAQIGWRDWRELNEAQPLLDSLQDANSSSSTSPRITLRANVRDALARVWTPAHLQSISTLLALAWIPEGGRLELAGVPEESALSVAEAVLASAWSDEGGRRTPPATSNRGFVFALGEEDNELIHLHPKEQQEAEWSNAFTAVSGFGIMVRRASPGQDIQVRPWKLVTGGDARLASGKTLGLPLSVPQRVVFDRNVWRAITEYAGTPLLTRSLLDEAYAETGHGVEGIPAADDGLVAFAQPSGVEQLAAPPLRYGDNYEVAAFVMDQGGGLPAALAKAGAPWQLEPARLDDPRLRIGTVPHPVTYRRSAPVGDLSVVPRDPGDAWPQLPKDVTLRCKEWWLASSNGAVQAPAVLLREALDPTIQASVPPQCTFDVYPPSIDEHVMLRWAAPPVGGMTPALMDALASTYTRLLLARVAEQQPRKGQEMIAHDPAVQKIGIRVRFFDNSNRAIAPVTHISDLTPVDAGQPFVMSPIRIEVIGQGTRSVVPSAGRVTIQVPKGEFACVEVFPLVDRSELAARFDTDAIAAQMATGVTFAGYAAFEPAVFLAETATSTLPTEADLYAGFDVAHIRDEASSEPVVCRFRQDVPMLAMVHAFTVERDKWVWRNLPMAALGDLAGLSGDALARRLSGALPDAAFTQPDTDDTVQAWEAIAGVDNGLSLRPPVRAIWPRATPSATHAGGTSANAVLVRDPLEGSPQGMYVRYRLGVTSRYAGVIGTRARSVQSTQWRRQVVPFRGLRIKPPKLVGLVPLTQAMADAPADFGSGARPFMVLLDETWFREYGVNERLEVVLSLENPEIMADGASGETAEQRDKRPYRIGRLPDHHVPEGLPPGADPYDASRYFKGVLTNEDGAAVALMRLSVFGPFGFTMDSTPDEALANATAFVVSPPAGWNVGPHWAMFVKLRRVLDYPATTVEPARQVRSDWSDVKSVYTLPDAQTLCTGKGSATYDSATQTLSLSGDLTWTLDPIAEANAAASLARSDYRYFLMVSRLVTDAGSESQKEVPLGLFRLSAPATSSLVAGPAVSADWIGNGALPQGELRGRLLEVWAEARLDGTASRLDSVGTPVDFWNGLLKPIEHFGEAGHEDPQQEDAAGMIRRVSGAFEVFSN
jgi:hypothetical protein